MTRLFDITTTVDAFALEANHRREILFTVTNLSARPVRATLKAKALDACEAVWLAIQGEFERTIAAGGTEPVTLVVAPPPGAPACSFRVRLNCASTNNPEEDFTEGPLVSIKLTAAGAVPKRNRMWLWLVVALVVLLVIAAIAYVLLKGRSSKPQDKVVPQIVGQPFESAKTQLDASGVPFRRFDLGITDDCPGKVLSTLPVAGQPVLTGTVVAVNVGVLASGPDTCKPGFVWREAFAGDHVCVTPALRTQAAQDNQQARSRTSPFGGPYGPDTCLQGYVWRDARQGDHVCVPGTTRQAAADDNRQAASRRACTP